MTFASEILKSDSERFSLVLLNPKKRLTGATSLGGGVYTFPLSSDLYIVDEVHANSSGLLFTHANDLLTVTSPSLNLTLGSVYTIVTFSLYVTATKTRVTSSVAGLPDANWRPILLSNPTVTQSMKNLIDGVFSLSASSIELITTDGLVQEFVATDASFSRCKVKIWQCVGSLSNNKVVFTGVVGSVSIQDSVASLNVIDSFLDLTRSATYGDDDDKTYVQNTSDLTTYPDISEPRAAAPLTVGYSSTMGLKEFAAPFTFGSPFSRMYHVVDALRTYKHTPSVPTGSTTDAYYFVSRFIGTDLKKITFGSVTKCYRYVTTGDLVAGNQTYTRYYYIKASAFDGEIGDCIFHNGTIGRAYICYNKQVTGPDGDTYDFVCFNQETLFTSGTAPSSGVITTPTLPDDTFYSYCVFRSDVSSLNLNVDVTVDTKDTVYYINEFNGSGVTPYVETIGTFNGETICAFYIKVNYSTSLSALGAFFRFNELSPSSFKVRFSPNTNMECGRLLKFICKSAGLSVNASTFDEADEARPCFVSLTFPRSNGSEFANYITDAQTVLKSSFSILRINEDREVEMKNVEDISATAADHVRSDKDILLSSFSTNVEYQDIYSTIVFDNPQFRDVEAIGQDGAGLVEYFPEAQYLHGSDQRIVFEHCLKDVTPVSGQIAGYLSSPSIVCQLSTSSKDLNTAIGDIVSADNLNAPTESEEVKGMVVEVSNATGRSIIKINDLRGVN